MTDNPVADGAKAGFVFNPFSEDPYPQYAELRAVAPVYADPFGFWILSEYREVSALLRSRHSSSWQNLKPGIARAVTGTAFGEDGPRTRGLSILDLDPPDHTRIRRLVAKVFTRRTVEAFEPRVIALVDDALDRIDDAGGGDLVAELAFPLPFTVISEVLGTPPLDRGTLRELVGIMVRTTEFVLGPEMIAEIVAAEQELTVIFRDVIEWKRRNPGDDMLTALLAVDQDGDSLSDDELIAQVGLLHIAGHETTVNLISGGILNLLRHPDQLALLRAQPDNTANAIEELLRYDSPVHLNRRITLSPYQVGEMEIPAGSFVIAALASANRDEKHWGSDADQLRLDRPNANQHLAFGVGVHHCIGAALARLVGRVAIGRLVQRFPALTLESVTWNGRRNLRGPANLTVTV